MIEIPCAKCISYAICVGKQVIECEILFDKLVSLHGSKTIIKADSLSKTRKYLKCASYKILYWKLKIRLYKLPIIKYSGREGKE